MGLPRSVQDDLKKLPETMSAKEVAAALGISLVTLRRRVERGAFPPPTSKALRPGSSDYASWQRTHRRWSTKLVMDFIAGKYLLLDQADCHSPVDWAVVLMDAR